MRSTLTCPSKKGARAESCISVCVCVCVSCRPALLIVQRNVNERAQLESQLGELSEAQLGLLSQIFPRYVIEQLGLDGALNVANLAQAARSHTSATIMFMGEWARVSCVTYA